MRRPSDRKSSLLLTSSTRNNETGAVLVIGLMFLAILALVGSTAVVLTSTDLKISANYKSSTQAFSAAQAGIEEARGRMRGNTDSSIRIPDPILTYDRTDYSWETYIGTDILAQNLSGYDPGDTIKNSIHSFPDIDYAVQILHVSTIGSMEPPMIGVMAPRESGRKRVSTNGQISVFHPLSQVLILVF